MIVARIAFRNLFLHKAKTALIGGIMCIGIMTLFVGNSLIDTAVEGIRRMFVEGYTGDLMVAGPTAFPVTIFGDTAGGEETVPHIAKFAEYRSLLESRKDVAGTMPMLTGRVAMGLGEQVIGQGSAFGVDIEQYRAFFSGNISIVQGDWPGSGSGAWVLLSEQSARMLSRVAGNPIGPGSKITLSAVGDSAGTVIREAEVKGVVRFAQSDSTLARISLVDADTMRDLLGFASLRDGPVKLTAQEASFVQDFNPDALFGEGSDAAAAGGDGAAVADAPAAGSGGAAGASVAESVPAVAGSAPAVAGLADEATVVAKQPDPAWQFLLVKARSGADANRIMKALGEKAASLGQTDRVQGWVESAGSTARTALTVRLVFDLLVSIVAVVVVIITMNALVVSVAERIPEIGTLRAIGARRVFVRKMILYETTFLACLAGALGLALGGAVLLVLGKSGIRAPNLFFEALFGGSVLVPRVSAGAALQAFAWILGMSLVSSLYPTAVALRIKPVVAMQGD